MSGQLWDRVRLWKHELRNRVLPEKGREYTLELLDWVEDVVEDARPVVFKIACVAEYCEALGSVQVADLRDVRPPYPSTFLEWSRPRQAAINSPRRVGMLVTDSAFDLSRCLGHKTPPAVHLEAAKKGADRMIWMLLFYESGSGVIEGGFFIHYCYLRGGELLPLHAPGGLAASFAFTILPDAWWDEEQKNAAYQWERVKLYPPLVAFQFLNCKRQVEIIDRKPNADKSEKHRRKTGLPLHEWKELVVRPLEKVLAAVHQGSTEADRERYRLHMVRGHFARYTEAAPMFGKYVGSFWHHPHLRGDPDLGVVEKSYAVEV
jgi:hypothetical protein